MSSKKKSLDDEMGAFFSGGEFAGEELPEEETVQTPIVKEEEKKQLGKIIPTPSKVYPEATQQSSPQPQEIRVSQDKPFIPTDLPKRQLDQIIENWAEKRKQNDIDTAYEKLTNFLFQENHPQPALTQTQPTVREILVKDNSDTIKTIDSNIQLINNQLLDSNIKDVAPLLLIKRNLQHQRSELLGVPYVEETSSGTQQSPVFPLKRKREYSFWKVGLPILGATVIITFGVIYALLAGLI